MLLRIWRTGVNPARWREYERFEQEYSLPMFRQQPGCRGVLFVRAGDGMGAAACSFWDDQQAIERLRNSPTYQGTVARLVATGLLTGEQTVVVYEVAGGALDTLPGVQLFKAMS